MLELNKSEKIEVHRKTIHRNSKPGREIRLETQIRNLQQQAKMIRQRKNAGTYWDKKEKATQVKKKIQLKKINRKVLVKEARLKRYRNRIKQYRQYRTIQNNEKKILLASSGGDRTKTYQQLDDKETIQFWSKIWQRREHNRKPEWISNIGKELKRTQRRTEGENTHRFTQSNIPQKYQIGKLQAMMAYMDLGSKH